MGCGAESSAVLGLRERSDRRPSGGTARRQPATASLASGLKPRRRVVPKNGIYILENMDVRALTTDEVWEFLFVLGQPRFEGTVQAVINPVAIR